MAGIPKQMKLTKIEAIRLHRRMWRWLAKNPYGMKREWPWFKNKLEYRIINMCFLCTYALDKCKITHSKEHMCTFCPLDWPVSKPATYLCEASYFSQWRTAYEDGKERTRLALKIARLKIKPVIKNKGSVWRNKKKE